MDPRNQDQNAADGTRMTREDQRKRGVHDLDTDSGIDGDETRDYDPSAVTDGGVADDPRLREIKEKAKNVDDAIDSPGQSGDSLGLGWSDTDSPGDLDRQAGNDRSRQL